MELFFRTYGEGSPLLILHGLFGQSDNWNTLAKKIAENNFTVYTIDLRNHGQSPHNKEMNYEVMAKDVHELIKKENIHHPSLLGHSMGGKVAMMYDYLFPDTLSKLIVADIAPKQYPPDGHQDVFHALQSINFNTISLRKEAEQELKKHLHNEAVVQFLLKNIYWKNDNQLDWRFNLNAIIHHYPEIIAALPTYTSHTPALFIKGEKSHYITEKDHTLIKKTYPHAQIITIPNAGHWVHAEQPQLFINEILKFL